MKSRLLSLPPAVKGIMLALLATLGMANVYVFSKAAMLEVSYWQFQFWWFAFAMTWITVFMVLTGMYRKIPALSRTARYSLVIIGFLELGAASTFFLAIRLMENPTVVSFLFNLSPIFVTLLGIRFLKERFNTVEAFGILLTLTGVILITYTRNTGLADLFNKGTGLILVSSLMQSSSLILAKARIRSIHPGILTTNRIVFLLIFAIIMVVIRKVPLQVPSGALFNMMAGSLLGPFLSGLASYGALHYIEASRSMIIQSTRSLFVLVGSMVYLQILPGWMQLSGGLITIGGVVIMTWGKMREGRSLKNSPPQS
ncbi:MAG: DMT family transporter [Bacteroidota bacterium]